MATERTKHVGACTLAGAGRALATLLALSSVCTSHEATGQAGCAVRTASGAHGRLAFLSYVRIAQQDVQARVLREASCLATGRLAVSMRQASIDGDTADAAPRPGSRAFLEMHR